VHLAGWAPLILLAIDFYRGNLTANPIQAIEQRTGRTALLFLLFTLACSPVSDILGWRELIQYRKAFGNYGFLYASLHVMTFTALDYGFDLAAIWQDVGKKVYVIVGLIAFLMLFLLAITSFKGAMNHLGTNWTRLHSLIYIAIPLVVFHFILVVKGNLASLQGNILQPLRYGLVVLVLLVLRISPIKLVLVNLRQSVHGYLRVHLRIIRAFHE